MLDDHEVVSLFYNPDINRFIDEFGSVIQDIFRLITPSQLMIFKEYKNHYVVPDVTNSFLVELVHPEDFDLEDIEQTY